MISFFQRHKNKKTLVSIFVTIVAIAIPMIEFHNIHLLLFDFYDKRFELFFYAWEVDIAGLTTIFFVFAFSVILLFNFTYSRYFCGYICPKTLLKNLFIDIIEIRIFKILKVKDRQSEKSFGQNSLKTFLAYLSLSVIILLGSMPIFFYFMPYDIFFLMLFNHFDKYEFLLYIWLLSALYLFAEVLFFKEFFCSFLCPYQLVNSITVNEKRGFYNFVDKEKCIDCKACVKVCLVPELDVRKGFDTRCIACGDCSAVCHDVMQHEGYEKSLIEYQDSNNEKSKAYFSFADKKISLLLIVLIMIASILIVKYFISFEHLSSCKISNSFLYQ